MAATNGIPKPPFLIMEPKGAPIKNSTKQAIENENFLCHSIWLKRVSIFFPSSSFPVNWKLLRRLLDLLTACSKTGYFAESGISSSKLFIFFETGVAFAQILEGI